MTLGASSVFLTDIAILTISALLFSLLFARFRLPVVGGEILAGVIVGPFVLNLVRDPNVINEISQIGVVLLLFVLGLELDPKEIRKIILRIGALTALEVIISVWLIFVGTLYLTGEFTTALIVAVALSFTSTAIIGRMLIDYFQPGKRAGRSDDYQKILISLLVVEDVIAVLFLVFIPELSGQVTNPSEGIVLLSEVSLGGIALIISSYLFGRYIAPRIINYFAHFEMESSDIPFLFSLGLGVIFGALASYLGYSPAIGSFMIGLALRGKYSRFVSQRIKPIRDLFMILFFVSIGTLIDPFAAATIPLVLVGVIFLALSSKALSALLAGSIFSTGMSAPNFALWLLPRGEFSLIIAQSALQSNVISINIFSVIGIFVMLTALIGPVVLSRRGAGGFQGKGEFPLRPKVDR